MRHLFNHASSGALRADSIDVTGTVTAASLVGRSPATRPATHYGDVVRRQRHPDGYGCCRRCRTRTPSSSGHRPDLGGVVAARSDDRDRQPRLRWATFTATLATLESPTFGAELVGPDGKSSAGSTSTPPRETRSRPTCSIRPRRRSSPDGRVGFASDPSGTGHALIGRAEVHGLDGLGWQVYVTDAGT